MKTCLTCKAFAALNNECRLKSPKVFPLQQGNGQIAFISAFPPTAPANWCMEHIKVVELNS